MNPQERLLLSHISMWDLPFHIRELFLLRQAKTARETEPKGTNSKPSRSGSQRLKRFGKNLDLLQSFIVNQLYLLYRIPILFEPSYDKGEPSLTDIFAQGFGVDQLGFLPKDLTADFQQFSNRGLLSITKMNAVLDEATEEDLRRARTRSEVV